MKIILCISITISLMACNSIPNNSFKIKGVIEGAEPSENIMLYYYLIKDGEWHKIADTTKIINGKFEFTGYIDELIAAELCFEKPANIVMSIRLFLEPTTMKLRINKIQPYLFKLSGTTVEKENIELRKELEPYEKIFHENTLYFDDLLAQIYLNTDNILLKDSLFEEYSQCKAKMITVRQKMNDIRLDFIKRHKTFRIIPDLLFISDPIDSVKSIYNSLPEKSKSSLMGKLVHKKIEYQIEYQKNIHSSEENSLVGCTAPDFTRQDAYGNTISLLEFKNKNFVFLDFWASWCHPCISNIPQLINVYEQYSHQGFVFIGISFDSDSAQWLNAIETHKLGRWPQILSTPNEKDFTVDYEHIGNIYNASYIPCYILIDKQGKIAARWEGDIEEEQLAEIEMIINRKQ